MFKKNVYYQRKLNYESFDTILGEIFLLLARICNKKRLFPRPLVRRKWVECEAKITRKKKIKMARQKLQLKLVVMQDKVSLAGLLLEYVCKDCPVRPCIQSVPAHCAADPHCSAVMRDYFRQPQYTVAKIDTKKKKPPLSRLRLTFSLISGKTTLVKLL